MTAGHLFSRALTSLAINSLAPKETHWLPSPALVGVP